MLIPLKFSGRSGELSDAKITTIGRNSTASPIDRFARGEARILAKLPLMIILRYECEVWRAQRYFYLSLSSGASVLYPNKLLHTTQQLLRI